MQKSRQLSEFIGTPLLWLPLRRPRGHPGRGARGGARGWKAEAQQEQQACCQGQRCSAVQCSAGRLLTVRLLLRCWPSQPAQFRTDWPCCRCLPPAGEPSSAKPASKPAIAPPPGLPPPPTSPLAVSSPAAGVSRPTSFKQVAAAGIRPAGGSPKEGQAGGPETPAPGLQASVDSNCPCSSWLSHLLYLG